MEDAGALNTHFRERLTSEAKAVNAGGRAAIDHDLQEDLADFFNRNAEVLGTLPTVEKYAERRTSESVFPKLTTIEEGHRKIVEDPPLIFHFEEHVAEAEAALRDFFQGYRSSLFTDRQLLFDRYQLEDIAVKVVGVGSVGTRCAIALFISDGIHPLFLQIKEARRSVLESPDSAESRFSHQGERVVHGQRLMQAASDIFLGWVRGPAGRDFYVRQLRDMKGGQLVTIRVDMTGRDYKAHLQSIAGASGAVTSLLPPENATGNFVKVVQRIPVKITFDPGETREHVLRPGMSVVPKVWIR